MMMMILFALMTALLIVGNDGATDSKAMEGLSCRQVVDKVHVCTGKNEEFRIGFYNGRNIATMKLRQRKKYSEDGDDCNSTAVNSRETLLPTLMHDVYGRLRFIFQDEENNLTQDIQLATCGESCDNGTMVEPVFSKYDLVSWDPFYNYFDPQIVTFKVITCCSCKTSQ